MHQRNSHTRLKRALITSVVLTLATSACSTPTTVKSIDDVHHDLSQVQSAVFDTQQQLEAWQHADQAQNEAQSEQYQALTARLAKLDNTLQAQCPPTEEKVCETQPQVVVNAEDKMVLGEVERVWIDPPGIHMVARIDTGASSSSLNATQITPFERDGDNWVRFVLPNAENEVTIERPVSKYVRVFQQADKTGSRRPVVDLHLVLGDMKATFSFTLADRSHLEHNMILGRNFLTDMALVDVSKQFVQPQFQPEQ